MLSLLSSDSEDGNVYGSSVEENVEPSNAGRDEFMSFLTASGAELLRKMQEDLEPRLQQMNYEYGFAVTFLQTYSGADQYDVTKIKNTVCNCVAEVIGSSAQQIVVEPGIESEKWRQAGHIALMIQVLSSNENEAAMYLQTIPNPLFSKTIAAQLKDLGFKHLKIENTLPPRLVKLQSEFADTPMKKRRDNSIMGDEYDSEFDVQFEQEQSDALESGEHDNLQEVYKNPVFNGKTPRRRGGNSFYVPTPNDNFVVEGSNPTIANMIDGIYIQQPQIGLPNERPMFVRLSPHSEPDPMVMWYYPKRRCWMLGPRSIVGSDDARAIVKCDVDHPYLIAACNPNPTWFDWNMETQGFQPNPEFSFRRAMPHEVKIARPTVIRVAGRVGYNRAMNGVYVRGKKPHCGKHYYQHRDQDFKVRWFQNEGKPGGKWVIDWRMGLNNDNVGAAVIKEDTPEPWMCATGWRVYDARIQQANKWVIDETVKVNIVNPKESELFD